MSGSRSVTLRGFGEFCSTLTLEDGSAFQLQGYQRQVLKAYFEGARETVCILPKKNGKTSMLAALALYHLREVPDAECVIAAASRDQALILFKQAAGLVHRSRLQSTFAVKPGLREIKLTVQGSRMGSRIRVLAADSTTADGVIPTLALVDELHRHPSSELYGVFRDGLGPRNGQIVTISTAGGSVETPLGELRAKAQLLPSFCREGCYSYASSDDGSFVLHEWSLEPDDDASDMKLVKQANPAPWHTVASLRERFSSPSTTPGQWARFACGLWVDAQEPWVTAPEWDGCDDPLPDLSGRRCVAGLDLSSTTDTTALVLLFGLVDGKVAVSPQVFLPKDGLAKRMLKDRAPYDQWARDKHLTLTDGSVVDYAFVKEAIFTAAAVYDLRQVGYDRWNASHLVQELEAEGVPLVPVGQGFRDMAGPMQELRRLVLARKIIHGGNPVLRRHILSMGTTTDPAGNAKPAKNKSVGRIDAAAALVMGLGVMARTPEPSSRKSAYEDQLCSCAFGHPTPHLRGSMCA